MRTHPLIPVWPPELLVDMLDILRDLVSHQSLPLISKLHCCRYVIGRTLDRRMIYCIKAHDRTAFQTMKFQGDALDIDLKVYRRISCTLDLTLLQDYYTLFYSNLYNILHAHATDERVLPAAIECLTLMIGDKKQVRLLLICHSFAYLTALPRSHCCFYQENAYFISVFAVWGCYICCLSGSSTIKGMVITKMYHNVLHLPRILISPFTFFCGPFLISQKYPKTEHLLDTEIQASGVYRYTYSNVYGCRRS